MVYDVNGVHFKRRLKRTINQSAVNLSDYQLKVTVLYKSAMQADFDDIRFTTMDGTNIPYWIESKTDSTTAEVWLKIPSISSVYGAEIWQYYGNPDVSSASSGSDTFIGFFDGDSDGWIEVDPNSHISFTNNRLEFTNLNRNENAYVYKSIAGLDAFEYTFSAQITAQESAFTFGYAGISDGIETLGSALNSMYINRDKLQAYTIKYVSSSGTVGEFISSDETAIIYYKGTLLNDVWTVKAYSDAEMTSQISVTSDISVADLTLTDLDYLYILSSHNTGNSEYYASGWVDDFKLRKYTATEPTWTTSGEEQHQRIHPQFQN